MSDELDWTLDQLIRDQKNANEGTERGQELLAHSIDTYGLGRSILIDKEGRIIAGNKTVGEAERQGLRRVIVVPVDGETLVAVQRTDLDLAGHDPRARLMAYADNRVAEENIFFDAERIQLDLAEGLDLSDLFTPEELDFYLDENGDSNGDGAATNGEPRSIFSMPEAIFPSDNEWGIPLLRIDMQAEAASSPFVKWGDQARSQPLPDGMYHFYTDDYKFNALWADPLSLLVSGVYAIVEPNFTTDDTRPLVETLWALYRKRYLARLAQENGIKVFVDMNVATRAHSHGLTLLGVPEGWRSYATRCVDHSLHLLEAEYKIAKEHAGQEPLFLVYGGGRKTEMHCQERGYLWFPENMHVKDGRRDGAKEQSEAGRAR